MFGNKKDNFKYENEVKALIQETTFGLTQRVIALETQNQQLIQELNHLKNGLCYDFQRLEKRITDFTDLWNPFMQQTMNRIKEDLEKTVIDSQREDIEKVHVDLEKKMAKMIHHNEEIIIIGVVGYNRSLRYGTAIVTQKNSKIVNEMINRQSYPGSQQYTFYLEQLKKLTEFTELDFLYLYATSFISKNNEICHIDLDLLERIINHRSKVTIDEIRKIKIMFDFCYENKIKIKYNGIENSEFETSVKKII